MSSENKEKEEELKERNRRIQKTINEMDDLKKDVTKWNNQLKDDLESSQRYLNNLISSGVFSKAEIEMVSDYKNTLYKIDKEREYEYDSFVKTYNKNKDRQMEEKDFEEKKEDEKE